MTFDTPLLAAGSFVITRSRDRRNEVIVLLSGLEERNK